MTTFVAHCRFVSIMLEFVKVANQCYWNILYQTLINVIDVVRRSETRAGDMRATLNRNLSVDRQDITKTPDSLHTVLRLMPVIPKNTHTVTLNSMIKVRGGQRAQPLLRFEPPSTVWAPGWIYEVLFYAQITPHWLCVEWVWGLLQPGFVRWAPLLHMTTLATDWTTWLTRILAFSL